MTHGGQRKNAGRPKHVENAIRRTVYIDQRHVELVNQWRTRNHVTFSEALRQVLDYAKSELQ